MNFLATLLVALNALRVNKMRSALTMLGIIIGVAAVIVMIAVGSGAQAKVEDQIRSLGSNLILVFSASATFTGARSTAGSLQTISEDDAYAIARELPEEIQTAAPVLRGSGQVVAGNANWSTTFYGVTPEYFEAREWQIAEGRARLSLCLWRPVRHRSLARPAGRRYLLCGNIRAQTLALLKRGYKLRH